MSYNTRSQTRATTTTNKPSESSSTSTLKPTSSSSYGLHSSSVVSPRSDGHELNSRIKVVSWLQLLLDPVLKCPNLGDSSSLSLKNPIILGDVRSSASINVLEKAGFALGDYITLKINYADTDLKWTFSFCWMDPAIPPDVTFEEDDFLPTYYDYEEFYNWDPETSVDCLLKFIRRLFADYCKYQLDLCEKYDVIQFQLTQLREGGHPDGSYDVHTYRDGARRGDVIFIFPIHPSAVTDLPAKYLQDKPIEEIRLKIRFTSFGNDKTHADLELPPFYNKLFNAKSPPLPRMECLVSEYVDGIRQILDEEIGDIIYNYKFKQEFIVALIAGFPRGSLIEYCMDDYTSVSFLLDHQDFKYILKVNALQKFPSGSGSLQLVFTSVYHEQKPGATKSKIRHPMVTRKNLGQISSSYSVQAMVDRIREMANNFVSDFKRTSCQEGV